jgi:hypothetical protein
LFRQHRRDREAQRTPALGRGIGRLKADLPIDPAVLRIDVRVDGRASPIGVLPEHFCDGTGVGRRGTRGQLIVCGRAIELL